MIEQLLNSYGAPMNAQNANRAREFYASNPQAAERRAMGMRGSIAEDNTDLLDSMLEKHIQATALPSPIEQSTMPSTKEVNRIADKYVREPTTTPAPTTAQRRGVNVQNAQEPPPPSTRDFQRGSSAASTPSTAMRDRVVGGAVGGAPNMNPNPPNGLDMEDDALMRNKVNRATEESRRTAKPSLVEWLTPEIVKSLRQDKMRRPQLDQKGGSAAGGALGGMNREILDPEVTTGYDKRAINGPGGENPDVVSPRKTPEQAAAEQDRLLQRLLAQIRGSIARTDMNNIP